MILASQFKSLMHLFTLAHAHRGADGLHRGGRCDELGPEEEERIMVLPGLARVEVKASEGETDDEGKNDPLVKSFHHKMGHLTGLTRNRLNGSKKGGGPPMGHPDPRFGGPLYTHLTPTSRLPHPYPPLGRGCCWDGLFNVSHLKATG